MLNNSILIVDDEVSYLELMKGLLEQEGYQNVITEENPIESNIYPRTKGY